MADPEPSNASNRANSNILVPRSPLEDPEREDKASASNNIHFLARSYSRGHKPASQLSPYRDPFTYDVSVPPTGTREFIPGSVRVGRGCRARPNILDT